jgi:hypothetical protein
MKRRNIFFALAFILAIGSAFTTRPMTSKPRFATPGYTRSTGCSPIVIFCDQVPNFACTLPTTKEQAYKDQFTCVIPLTRSTLH